MKSINTIFLNLIQRIKNAVLHSDENLQTAKNYTVDTLDDFIIYRDFTSASKSMSANSGTTFTINITIPSGYKYLCNVHSSVGGDIISTFPDRSGVNLTTNKINVYVFNTRSYTVNATATIRVLFVKILSGGVTRRVLNTLKRGCFVCC